MPIYDVAAYFNRRIRNRDRATSRDKGQTTVSASTPESAARMWLWRLTEEEREATVRLVVFAPKPKAVIIPNYDGEPVRFVRQGGQLVELAPGP